MNCPVCNAEMVALFTSLSCPKCEGGTEPPPPVIGYIVWRNRPPGSTEYVFKTEHDAKGWATCAGLTALPIRRVRSAHVFTWRESSGTAQGLILAEGVYEVYDVQPPGTLERRVWLDD